MAVGGVAAGATAMAGPRAAVISPAVALGVVGRWGAVVAAAVVVVVGAVALDMANGGGDCQELLLELGDGGGEGSDLGVVGGGGPRKVGKLGFRGGLGSGVGIGGIVGNGWLLNDGRLMKGGGVVFGCGWHGADSRRWHWWWPHTDPSALFLIYLKFRPRFFCCGALSPIATHQLHLIVGCNVRVGKEDQLNIGVGGLASDGVDGPEI